MRRLLNALAWMGAAALLTVSPAAAQPFATQTIPSTSVRVIQLPRNVAPADLWRLVAELRSPRHDGLVVLLPESAVLEREDPGQLAAAREALAAAAGRFDLLRQPDGRSRGDAAAELQLRAAHDHRLSGAPCDAGCVEAALLALERGGDERAETDEGVTRLRSVITAPEPEPGRRIGLMEAALAVALLALAAVLTAVLIRRMRAPSEPPPGTAPDDPPPPTSDGPPPPLRGAHARRAQVVSVLDPEGYVEVERCLRRAGWAGDGPPPNPGEWVEIEQRSGRLWAFRPKPRARSTAGA